MSRPSFVRTRSAIFFDTLFRPSLPSPMIRRTCLLAASAISASLSMGLAGNASAADFSGMVFFGDSLTDSGYFKGIGQQPSFTTNPDPVWAQILAHDYGLSANPAAVLTPTGVQNAGGTDYAVGGARVSTQNGYPSPSIAPFVPTVSAQVNGYLAANARLDSKGLYGIWAGANDIIAYTQQNIAGLLNPATQVATGQKVAGLVASEALNVVGLIGQLQRAGAGTVLVVNLPDVGRTPLAASEPPGVGTLWSASAGAFNATLNAGLTRLGGNVVALNAFGLLSEIIANPTPYGFKNVTTPACTSLDGSGNLTSSLCTRATLVEPNANQTYLFADGIHPTGAGHAIIAEYAMSVLQAPSQIGMLAEAPLATAQTQLRAIDNRLRLTPRVGQAEAYAVYDNTRRNLDRNAGSQGLDDSTNSATVGVDFAINQNWLVGAAFGYGENKADFGSNSGGFKLNQGMLSAYTQYRDGAWAVNALGMAGSLDYSDVSRNITLGQALRSEHGSTEGRQLLLRAGGQYDFKLGTLTASPVASLTWQQIKVDGYDETGSDSTAMRFENQTRNSLISSLGVQLTSVLAVGQYTLQPFAKLAWEKEYKDNPRDVRAHVLGMGGSFGLPADQGPDSTTRLDLGASMVLGADFNVFAGYSGQFASGSKAHSFQLGLKKAF